MKKTVKMICPVTGCSHIAKTQEDWVDHFSDKHPDQEELNIGGKKIKLKGE